MLVGRVFLSSAEDAALSESGRCIAERCQFSAGPTAGLNACNFSVIGVRGATRKASYPLHTSAVVESPERIQPRRTQRYAEEAFEKNRKLWVCRPEVHRVALINKFQPKRSASQLNIGSGTSLPNGLSSGRVN